MTDSVFVSTTIPYVNARPHLGHAFEFVQADVTARHLARQGKEVFFTSGTDENSLKNVQSAEKNGESTAGLVERHAADFARLMAELGVVVDRFTRTSVDADHRLGAAALWQLMADRGDIYSRFYEGLYCVGCEEFRTSDELVGGRCAVHRTEPAVVRERNYFFRLSKYQDAIVAALSNGELRIRPDSRRNEMLRIARGGLTDISISRSVGRAHGWGIPVPGDDSQVMYVWIDALTNYVNALGWVRGSEDYERHWRDAGQRIHLMGKDVTRFHAIYWPAMLMSAGLPLPTDVVVHGHVMLSGQKLSKSLGNVVDPFELMHRYSAEAVRFLMLAEFSPWADVDFTDQRLVARYNTDLANGLGNLVDRVTGLTQRYRDGVVPEAGRRGPLELSLLDTAVEAAGACREALDRFDHREAVARIWDLVRGANKYVNQRAPWDLAEAAGRGEEDATQTLDNALHDLVATLRTVALLLGPILPGASAKVLSVLGLAVPDMREDGFSALDGWSPGVARAKVASPPHLFPRRFERAVDAVRADGFPVVLAESATGNTGIGAAGPAALATELHELLTDERVGAVLCATGGYTSSAVLAHVDWDLVREVAIPIIGYSDITSMLWSVLSQAGLVSFHGPMLISEWGEWGGPWAYTLENLRRALNSGATPAPLREPDRWTDETLWWDKEDTRRRTTRTGSWRCLVPGEAEGWLLPGCAATAALLFGTRYLPDVDGALLCLEFSDMGPDQVWAHLVQWADSGLLDRVSGLVVGRHAGPRPAAGGSLDFDAVVLDVIGTRRFPVLADVDFGHTEPMLTLPVGGHALLDATARELTLLEPATTTTTRRTP